jgi:mersacidin/lichenicidin family type 2 lantibiotic
MSQHVDILRAWKDAEYRRNLSEAALAWLPDHPSGLIELTDRDLDEIEGGQTGSDTWGEACLMAF